MVSPITFDFGELYSVFVASIVGVHVTLSYNAQRMFQLSIDTFVCILLQYQVIFFDKVDITPFVNFGGLCFVPP